MRASVGVGSDDVVVTFLGRLLDIKRVDEIPAVAARVRATKPTRAVHYFIIGEGPERERIEKSIAKHDVADLVHMLGYVAQPDLGRWLAASDIGLILSSRDNSPKALNEMMNFGMALVATEIAGTTFDLVRERQNGHVVGVGDVDAVAGHIVAMVNDDVLERYGKRSLEIVSRWSFAADVSAIKNAALRLDASREPARTGATWGGSSISTQLVADGPAFAVTKGPAEHFFGYFNLCPWNKTGDHLLLHRTTSKNALPLMTDEVELLALPNDDYSRPIFIGRSSAWNWQQGTLLQWLGPEPHRVVYNVRDRSGAFRARLVDIRTGEGEELERPVYHVAPCGRLAYSVDFRRLHFARRGYGYTVPDATRDQLAQGAPVDDGIWRIDLETGLSELFIPLRRLVFVAPEPSMATALHWVDHIQVSRGGSFVAFFHRWMTPDGAFSSRLMVADRNADDVVCLVAGGSASHYDWRDDTHILGWLRPERRVNNLRSS
ncbi:MAG: glycosyltransferase family 4 protein, partial [Myxococcales bacterium]|nr:glycosyltransferase family 4 protein [Myxococcales bacterium]